VPTRAKTAAIPLFDGIHESEFAPDGDTGVAWATSESHLPTSVSRVPPSASRMATVASWTSDTDVGPYKEEQDLLNKTKEQNLFNKTSEEENTEIRESAQRIINILNLPNSSLSAATAAVEERRRQTKLSMDAIVGNIVTAANLADRRGVEKREFLEDFLAEQLARQILKSLDLPVTNSLISTVKASLKAEVTYTRLSLEKVADLIANAGIEDRQRGIAIDRFYFEGVKWRSNVRVSKAEQRKLDNLEVNARVKQRLRERLGAS
jgi:hypothetical protein